MLHARTIRHASGTASERAFVAVTCRMLTRPGSMLSTENGLASNIESRKRAPSNTTGDYDYNDGLNENEGPQKKRRQSTAKEDADDDDSTFSEGRRARGKQSSKQNDKAGRKQNHVAAEKKRREAIRRGFDQITAVVPELEYNQSRSEALVLEKILFLQNLKAENEQLLELAREHNVDTRSYTPL